MAGRNLVAYFTRSGNTRRIANLIQQEVGGTLHEIQPEVPYPSAYDAVVEQAKVEIQAGYKPALRSTLDDMERSPISVSQPCNAHESKGLKDKDMERIGKPAKKRGTWPPKRWSCACRRMCR
jgi:hypothetical protein